MGGGFGSKFGPDVQGIVCAKLAREAGAQYVVWTAWHGNMLPMFPSQVAQRYGYGSRCSTRDTVIDMIDACRARGLRVYLYTHPYQPISPTLAIHTDYINDLYAEVVERYGSRMSCSRCFVP